jgi:hypothetical protein
MELEDHDDDDTSRSGIGYDDLTSSKCLKLRSIMQYTIHYSLTALLLVSRKDMRWMEWLY